MPSDSSSRPPSSTKQKFRFDKENSFRQRIWKLWLVIFAGVLTAAFTDGMNALHAVQMIDRQKTLWNVYYVLQKRPDGTWRISSCETEKAETNLI